MSQTNCSISKKVNLFPGKKHFYSPIEHITAFDYRLKIFKYLAYQQAKPIPKHWDSGIAEGFDKHLTILIKIK